MGEGVGGGVGGGGLCGGSSINRRYTPFGAPCRLRVVTEAVGALVPEPCWIRLSFGANARAADSVDAAWSYNLPFPAC